MCEEWREKVTSAKKCSAQYNTSIEYDVYLSNIKYYVIVSVHAIITTKIRRNFESKSTVGIGI